MSPESIIDDSKPNAGRMYDYYLGGNHNFEVDRQAAAQVLKIVPFVRKYARLQRWALQDIADELSVQRGYDVIIDFASGLPTNDHIHHKVSSNVTVIYSDYDPVVVEYAQEILKNDFPNVHYFHADARQPGELLNRLDVQKILDGRRKVAMVYWGVSIFLNDAELAAAMSYLNGWAEQGSCLAYNAQGAIEEPTIRDEVTQIYARLGTPVYVRSLASHKNLIQPWQIDGSFISLLEWHGFEKSELSHEDTLAFGPMGGGYGAYLIK